MKRFLIDALLIIFLVGIITMISNQEKYMQYSVQESIAKFEDRVDQGAIVGEEHVVKKVSQIEENTAGKLGKKMSELVLNTLDSTTEMMSSLFDQLVNK